MSDYRVCVRGCAYRGKHREGCPGGECRGCLPARTVPGLNVCTRCLRRMRDVLGDAPDLAAHLRSLIDPRRSTWNFDRQKSGPRRRRDGFPPMNLDAVQASSEVVQILAGWAVAFGDSTVYHVAEGLPSRVTPEEAFGVSRWAAQFLVMNLERIAATSDVRMFARHVIDMPADPDEWTIAKALARFPLDDRPRWSPVPCPGCGLRGVRVRPPRRGRTDVAFECRGCGWVPPERERAVWEAYFAEVDA